MFEKFIKNKEEMLITIGNSIVALVVIGSFIWFLRFSLDMVERAISINTTLPVQTLEFRFEEFEDLKVLFNRKDVGFSALEKQPAKE